MRQQKPFRLNQYQQGYALITVLTIMVLISLMIIATYTSVETNLKSSANDTDLIYAQTLAEQATKIASRDVARQFSDETNGIFPPLDSYDQTKYPILFAQFLEGGPKLTTLNNLNWPQYFTNDCSGGGNFIGFCAPSVVVDNKQYGEGIPVTKRENVFNQYDDNKTCVNAVQIDNDTLPNNSARNPCYVVEFLGISTQKEIRYRITVVAWGKNPKTRVVLESIYETDYD